MALIFYGEHVCTSRQLLSRSGIDWHGEASPLKDTGFDAVPKKPGPPSKRLAN
jgi:hypothetical protein